MLKCLVLINGTVLIGKIEEIDAELGDPNCQVTDFLMIDSDNKLKQWATFSDDKKIMLRSENILTILDPSKEVAASYYEVIQ